MQIDFHYCVTKILALKAGFDDKQAQKIAYASQFVDDETNHKPFRIKNSSMNFVPECLKNFPRFKNNKFDPIRTAHKGVQYLAGLLPDVQKNIYIPFHFIPSEKYDAAKHNEKNFSFTVIPNSPFAQELVDHAIENLKQEFEPYPQKLIGLGIALHSYADTFSHQFFSGNRNVKDNDIHEIETCFLGKWNKIGSLRQLYQNIFPSVGHSEAGILPDLTYPKWRYRKEKNGEPVMRDNVEIFMTASKFIFEYLLRAAEIAADKGRIRIFQPEKWSSFQNELNLCLLLEMDGEKKLSAYKKLFSDIDFHYNPEEWFIQALIIKNAEMKLSRAFLVSKNYWANENYEFGQNLNYFYFHLESYHQRKWVLENIPPHV